MVARLYRPPLVSDRECEPAGQTAVRWARSGRRYRGDPEQPIADRTDARRLTFDRDLQAQLANDGECAGAACLVEPRRHFEGDQRADELRAQCCCARDSRTSRAAHAVGAANRRGRGAPGTVRALARTGRATRAASAANRHNRGAPGTSRTRCSRAVCRAGARSPLVARDATELEEIRLTKSFLMAAHLP